jgi:hypothetical protein
MDPLTDQEIEDFVDRLDKQVTRQDLDEAVRRGLGANPSAATAIDFCKAWPCAKPALEYLRDHIFAGGGWKKVVRWGISKLIAAGDEVYKQVCKEEEGTSDPAS